MTLARVFIKHPPVQSTQPTYPPHSSEKAMTKKFWMAFIAVFVTGVILNMIVYGLVLGSAFSSLPVWRADMQSLQ